MWRRREIENYLCFEETLLAYARQSAGDDLFALSEAERRAEVMRSCIMHLSDALKTLDKPSPWSADIKTTDDFLNPLFNRYFQELNLPPASLRKSDYHELVAFLPPDKIDLEVIEKLDKIVEIAQSAKPQ